MYFKTWYNYFFSNRNHFDHIDWNISDILTSEEKEIITSSIRQFQRGEHSEGKHFLQFAKSMKDDSYIDTVKIFIREEQDHAAVLGNFMDKYEIGKLKNDWLDNIFRGLRKLAGLEGTVTVLLTAEIISMVYYKALRAATGSKLLGQICTQILVDEEMHLQFQGFALHILYKRKPATLFIFSKLVHNILMAGTIIMVWFCHKRVLRKGRYNFFSFFSSVWAEFRRCRNMISNTTSAQPKCIGVNHAA